MEQIWVADGSDVECKLRITTSQMGEMKQMRGFSTQSIPVQRAKLSDAKGKGTNTTTRYRTLRPYNIEASHAAAFANHLLLLRINSIEPEEEENGFFANTAELSTRLLHHWLHGSGWPPPPQPGFFVQVDAAKSHQAKTAGCPSHRYSAAVGDRPGWWPGPWPTKARAHAQNQNNVYD
jgi:hypothetical protein